MERTLGQGLKAIALPNLQCSECFETLTLSLSDDKLFFTIEHLRKDNECSVKDQTCTVSVEDFHETFVSDK